MSEIQHAPLTIENVAYSVFMKIEENQNVLLTLTRCTFVHVPNHTGFTFHAVSTVGVIIFENVSEPTARALLLDLITFNECKNVLLMHDPFMFLFLLISIKIHHLRKWVWRAH